MENIRGYVRGWKFLEAMLAKVTDPILRNAMRYEFEKRAKTEWGFCPAETQTYKDDNSVPLLEPWGQEILDRINAYLEYGVDVRTDEEKQRLEARTLNNMIDFVDKGGTYWEIPEDIQCNSLKAVYDKAVDIVFDVKKFTKNA